MDPFAPELWDDPEEIARKRALQEAGATRRESHRGLRKKISGYLAKGAKTLGLSTLPGVAYSAIRGDKEGLNVARSTAEGVLGVPKSALAGLVDLYPDFLLDPEFEEKAPDALRDFKFTKFLDSALGEELDPAGEMLGRVAGEIGMTVSGAKAVGVIPLVARLPRLLRIPMQFAPVGFLFGIDEHASAVQAGADLIGPEAGEFARAHPLLRATAEAALFGAIDVGIEGAMMARGAKVAARAERIRLDKLAAAKAMEKRADPFFHTGDPPTLVEHQIKEMMNDFAIDTDAARIIVEADEIPRRVDADFAADVADEFKAVDAHLNQDDFVGLVEREIDDVYDVSGMGEAGTRVTAFFSVAEKHGLDKEFVYHRFLADLVEEGRSDLSESLARLMASSEATSQQMGDAIELAGLHSLGDDTIENILRDSARELENMGLDLKAGFVDVHRGLPEGVESFSTRKVTAYRDPDGAWVGEESTEFAGRMIDQETGELVPIEGVFFPHGVSGRMKEAMIWVDGMNIVGLGDPTFLPAAVGTRNLRKGIRFIAGEFPEAKKISFFRSGTTGGKEGRRVTLNLNHLGEGGFANDALLRAIARAGAGGVLGGAAGGLIGGGEGALAGFGLGAGANLLAPPALKGLRLLFTSSARHQAKLAMEELVEAESKAIFGMIDTGELLLPRQFNEVANAALAHIEKNLDVEMVMNRVRARLDKSKSDYSTWLAEDTAGRLDLAGKMDTRRFSNANLEANARKVGFDPGVLEMAMASADKTRIQGMRAVLEMQNIFDETLKLDALMLHVRGRVDDATWKRLQGAHSLLTDEMQGIGRLYFGMGSQLGRGMQALKHQAMAMSLFDPNRSAIWALEAERVSGKSLRPGDIPEIQKLLRAGDKDGMRLFMSKMHTRRLNFGQKFSAAVKAGLLLGPQTDVVNIGSTSLHISMRNVSNPGAVAFDRIFTAMLPGSQRDVALNVFTGALFEFKPGKLKIPFTGKTIKTPMRFGEGAKLGWEGGQVGSQAILGARDIWRGSAPTREMMLKWDYNAVRTGNCVADAYFHSPVRLGSEDAVMKGIAFHTSMHERAKIMVLNSGVKRGTKEFKEEVLRIIAEAPDEITIPSVLEAQVATYTNLTALGRGIVSAKHILAESGSAGAIVAELGIPFVNTLINVMGAVFNFSALGLVSPRSVRAMSQMATHMATQGKKPMTRELKRGLAEILSRAGTMGGALMILGAFGRWQGWVTGRYDKDAGAFRLTRVQPLALKLGKYSLSLENLTPAGNVFALGAMIFDVMTDPRNTEDTSLMDKAGALAGGAFASYSHQMSELTFLANVNTIVEGIAEPERGFSALAKGMGRMLIPTPVRKIAMGYDPVLRRVDGFGEAFISGVPFASKLLEPQIDVFGKPVVRRKVTKSTAGMIIEGATNPFRITRITDDYLALKLARLGVNIPRLSTVKRRGVEGRLRTVIEMAYGVDLRKRLEALFANPSFEKLPPEKQRELLEKVQRRSRTNYTRFLTAKGILPPPKDVEDVDPYFSRINVGKAPDPFAPDPFEGF